MFQRLNIHIDSDISIQALKDLVCQAVENEIQNEIKDYDVTDDEYIEIATKRWERFYSCCEQYHVKASQPIGLIQMNAVGAICVVKKNMFSLLRPCEPIEHLMIAGELADADDLIGTNIVEDHKADDLVQLVAILSYIEMELTEEIKNEIDKKLYQMELPNEIIMKMILDGNEYDENVS